MSEEQAKEKVSNFVTMENGETIDFGEKGKCFLGYDVAAGTVTAKTVTGAVINVVVADLPENIKQELLFWGLTRKLSSSILSTEAADVTAKINLEVDKLQKGKFSSRGMGGGSAELDDFQIAWALVNATGVVNTGATTFAVPELFITVEGLRPEWVDINNPKVIEDVLAVWDALPAKEKTAQRKNNNFCRMQSQFIESGAVEI